MLWKSWEPFKPDPLADVRSNVAGMLESLTEIDYIPTGLVSLMSTCVNFDVHPSLHDVECYLRDLEFAYVHSEPLPIINSTEGQHEILREIADAVRNYRQLPPQIGEYLATSGM
ncbi:MAG TPA: hypothetical protein VK171_15345 [Fimbriimonas sp.]|nr:hypothetical protein [Fimbriimonas sp.]